MIAVLVVSVGLPLFARAETSNDADIRLAQLDLVKTFEERKENALKILDAALQLVRDITTNVTKNTKMEQDAKTDLVRVLNTLEIALTNYRSRVDATQTQEELQAVNREVLQYLVDHRDDMANAIRDAVTKIAERIALRAEEFKQKVERVLVTMKVLCPSEKATIEAVERDLAILDTEIKELRASIQRRDADSMKSHLETIGNLSRAIADNLTQIQDACLGIGNK